MQNSMFQKVRYTYLPTFSEFHILGDENKFVQRCPHIVLVLFVNIWVTDTGSQGPDFVDLGSSRNPPKSIAICPGVKISHLGIIKNPQNSIIILKPGKPTNHLISVAEFWPLFCASINSYSQNCWFGVLWSQMVSISLGTIPHAVLKLPGNTNTSV